MSGKEVEEVEDVKEVEDRNSETAWVDFWGVWLTISGADPLVFLEVFILKTLKSIAFRGLQKCSF